MPASKRWPASVTSDPTFDQLPSGVADGFIQVAQVVNGASDLMRDVFGDEAGAHTRTALGVSAMPHGAILEVEAIFEVRT